MGLYSGGTAWSYAGGKGDYSPNVPKSYGAEQRPTVASAPVTNTSKGEAGCKYQFARVGKVVRIRYQRLAATPGTLTLRMWRDVGTVKVAEVSDIQSTTGAFEVSLPTPINVSAGETYTFTYSSGASQVPAFGGVLAVTNTADITFVDYRSGALPDSYPGTVESGASFHVEPIYQPLL